MAVLKIALLLAILLLLAYPVLPIKSKLKRFMNIYGARYDHPHNQKNLFFVLILMLEGVVLTILSNLLDQLAHLVKSASWISNLVEKNPLNVSSQFSFDLFAVRLVLINGIIIYSFLILKVFLKKIFADPIFGLTDKSVKELTTEAIEKRKEKKRLRNEKRKLRKAKRAQKRNKKKGETLTETPAPEKTPKDSEPEPEHEPVRAEEFLDREILNDGNYAGDLLKDKPKKHSPLYRAIAGLFFLSPDYEIARPWVARARAILQIFIYLTELLYLIFITAAVLSAFFPLPDWLYSFFLNVLRIKDWYLYPSLSILFLQEICYVLDTPQENSIKGQEDETKSSADTVQNINDPDHPDQISEEAAARLRALQRLLKDRFDKEHFLRYYPEVKSKGEPEYTCTSIEYLGALDFIAKHMKSVSGRTVQSYMKTLDTLFADEHIYAGVPFHSEFGEYVIAYTYTRLLSGARVIFVASKDTDTAYLKKYIRDRLTELTGSNEQCTWRVYTSDERLDQADVFIATPDDFKDDNIVDHYPGFFEEACNAIFINVDKVVAQESYLCCVMASRLAKSSAGRIRYLFLSDYMFYGAASATLPRFFCVDKVLNMSHATQSESVSYTLWNRESVCGRIYNISGHKLVNLESIIAEQAYLHGVDGIRILTPAALENAEETILRAHKVEINDLYKKIPAVNYMIYADEHFNLAASLFACTRFRGYKKSIAHIISRPYLLREYFISKTLQDDYINRASFIQPRMVEHANRQKLSLLRIFCDLTTDGGLPLEVFKSRMLDVIKLVKQRDDIPPCQFCKNLLENPPKTFGVDQLAAYLIAGLCDNEDTPEKQSEGHNAKDYYLISNTSDRSFFFKRAKTISFKRTKEVLERVFASNTRVELRLNDEVIGVLPFSFPKRVPLEYMVGNSIIYKNTEYEIEQISYGDGSDKDNIEKSKNCTIFLRGENVTFRNCLDTVFLRRYKISAMETTGFSGILQDPAAKLSEIKLQRVKLSFIGETYGFYNLMSDRQTLDFHRGVEGNMQLESKQVKENARNLTDLRGNGILVTLKSSLDCTDGMRLLLTAVFNEFIRTTFPNTYRCIAVCPILEHPLPYNEQRQPKTAEEQIESLYPYLYNPDPDLGLVEDDPHRIRLLFLNDCEEDVGVLDWFFDPLAKYMRDWLVYVQSYLHWLSAFKGKKHYIYFGGEELPNCYDLNGCLNLLKGYNRIFSDEGEKDYNTAADEISEAENRRCSFCHCLMDSGRFETFNKKRFICADCYDVVSTVEEANAVMKEVIAYLGEQYKGLTFREEKIVLDPPYDLEADQVLSEYYYKVDLQNRVIHLEKDTPRDNIAVSILRSLIFFWQNDNNLQLSIFEGQLYYEELEYLRRLKKDESANWIEKELKDHVKYIHDIVEAIQKFVKDGTLSLNSLEADFSKDTKEKDRNSFTFLRKYAEESDRREDETDVSDDEEYSDKLYNPDRTPRFWKRYLRGEKASGTEDQRPDDGESEDEGDSSGDSNSQTTEHTELSMMKVLSQNYCLLSPRNGDNPQKDESPKDEIPVDEIPVDEIPVDEIPVDEIPVDEIPVDEIPVDEIPVDEIPKDESPKDEIPEDESPKDEIPKDEIPKDEIPKDEIPEDEIPEDEVPKDEIPKDEIPEDEVPKDEIPKDEIPEDKIPEDESPKDESAKDESAKDESSNNEPSNDNAPEKETPEDKKQKKESEEKKKKRNKFSWNRKRREEKEKEAEEEKKFPKIRLYNDIVRHVKAYDETPISYDPSLKNDDVWQILHYVSCDYPEFFWLRDDCLTLIAAEDDQEPQIQISFRCKDENGRLDIKQIETKRKEIRQGAKYFTKGITKRTDPYEAFLKIYRRLVLTLEYDHAGAAQEILMQKKDDRFFRTDDRLRSLHSALVSHKVVCSGYAVALQYLMHSIGLPCGTVISELDHSNCGHAFNILKIGKYCYYVDPTWGDTEIEGLSDNIVHYQYCCVPLREFQQTNENELHCHTPNHKMFPQLEELKATTHEYHRYHNYFLARLDRAELIRVIAEQTLRYDPDEMGHFCLSIRFADASLAQRAKTLFESKDGAQLIVEAGKRVKAKNKKKAHLLDARFALVCFEKSAVLELVAR